MTVRPISELSIIVAPIQSAGKPWRTSRRFIRGGVEAVAEAFEDDGGEDDGADDHGVEVRVGVDENEAVFDGLNEEGPDEGAGKDVAAAAEEAGSAQDGGGDGGEFALFAEFGRDGAELAEGDHGCDGGAESADEVNDGEDAAGLDAGFARGFEVVAEGEDLAAEGGAGQNDVRE
jgi:hypothetical protein